MPGEDHQRPTPAHDSSTSPSSRDRFPPAHQFRANGPLSPASPPLSTVASGFDVSAFSQASVLTPPDSVPMSAEGSLQSGTGMAQQSDARSEPLPGRRNSAGRRESTFSDTHAEQPRSVSTKRKLSETELGASASKRQKSDPSLNTVTPTLALSSESAPQLYGLPTKRMKSPVYYCLTKTLTS